MTLEFVLPAAGVALTAFAAMLLYFASPHQRLVPPHGQARIFAALGVTGLIAALAILLGWAGRASAVFMLFTIAMLVWTIVPLFAAWWRRTKEAR
ncbi:hypothetical protein KY084_00035 [Stakelama sp. CBK3Z-3]|uniref:DUF3325 domain-containing protein n=1 Tax=Stakelama flava TaxID=2860338 RepID=A0ABS6XIG9_9SPHN|nr:hypothetical protein [Stakelama flava]MBW4329265.1 hypothetical protein [Stakelama flava]